MLGTFGGALEARKIDASDGRLTAEVRGEIESEDGVLVIRRIHVDFKLRSPEKGCTAFMRASAPYSGACIRRFRSHRRTH
jgi:hypothetical protein